MVQCLGPSIRVPVEFISAISHANSIESVLMAAAERLPNLVGSDFSVVTFVDEEKQISRAFGLDGATLTFGADTSIQPGTYGAQVLESGEPVQLGVQQLAQAQFGLMPKMLAQGIQSVLIAPMRSGGLTVGTLTVASRHDRGFDESVVNYVVALGKWVASQARLMQQARRSARMAETDPLTGLANRTRLRRVLNRPGMLHQADKLGRVIGILHVDLDHFKKVNDTLGHAAGDALLLHCAEMMTRTAGPKDLVARTGGDEFVVVTRTDPGGTRLNEMAHDLVRAISKPIMFNDVAIEVSASIGTALMTGEDCTGDDLIGNADMALYEVKRAGRGRVHRFNQQMRVENTQRMQLLSDMHKAVENKEFEPYFQPQVSLSSGYVNGFEMLARWNHPSLGVLDPADFLHLGDETGLTYQIDEIIRNQGLKALRSLRDQGWDAPKMSFNPSSWTLSRPNLIHSFVQEVADHGLAPQDLVLEIRERDLVDLGRDQALATMIEASKHGFVIQLEDVGRGRASVATLAHVAVNSVALDRGLVALLGNERGRTIAQHAIALSQNLGCNVIATGLETTAQFFVLQQLGCDAAQGYGISKPLPFDDLVHFMEGYGKAPVTVARSDDIRLTS